MARYQHTTIKKSNVVRGKGTVIPYNNVNNTTYKCISFICYCNINVNFT